MRKFERNGKKFEIKKIEKTKIHIYFQYDDIFSISHIVLNYNLEKNRDHDYIHMTEETIEELVDVYIRKLN